MRIRCAAFVIALATSMTVSATPALARTPPRDSVTVRLDDLDLAAPEGARVLMTRLERATEHVCGKAMTRRYPAALRRYRSCYRDTLRQAVQSVGAPRVQEEYSLRGGREGWVS